MVDLQEQRQSWNKGMYRQILQFCPVTSELRGGQFGSFRRRNNQLLIFNSFNIRL